MEKEFNLLLNESFVGEEGEDWLSMIFSEFVDDNEGLSEREFFKRHWQRFFPIDLDFMNQEEFKEFEVFLVNNCIRDKIC